MVKIKTQKQTWWLGKIKVWKGRNNIIIARLPEKLIRRVGNEAMVTVLTTRMGAIGPLEYGGVVDPTQNIPPGPAEQNPHKSN